MTRVLVIGYGNTLRGDDALGPRAAEHLRPLIFPAEVLACHQLSPELAAQLAEYDAAIFVDAAATGTPGEVRVSHVADSHGESSLTHHVSPAALLVLARQLYGRAPRALLVTAVGANFALHAAEDAPLSSAAEDALKKICCLVPRLLRDFPAGWSAQSSDIY